MQNRETTIAQAKENLNKARRLLQLAVQAQAHLLSARGSVDSARKWGIFDMLGGGFITNMIKHSKIDDGMQHLNIANQQLFDLSKEMKQLDMDAIVRGDIGSFAIIADFVFDGILADLYMQGRINELLGQIDGSLNTLDRIMDALERVVAYEQEVIRNG